MADVRLRSNEDAHAHLFKAHWDLLRAADSVHAVVMMMLDRERYRDERVKLAPMIENLRGVREKINEALREAGGVRTELIRHTGCDGSCKDGYPRKDPAPLGSGQGE